MYALTCHDCGMTHLMGPRSILSVLNTEGGVVGYVRCPQGHTMFVGFEGSSAAPVTDPRPLLV